MYSYFHIDCSMTNCQAGQISIFKNDAAQWLKILSKKSHQKCPSSILCIPYYSVSFRIISHYSVLFRIIPYYFALICVIPYYSLLFRIIRYYSALFHIILYYFVNVARFARNVECDFFL